MTEDLIASEKRARAFAGYFKLEHARSDRCLNDIIDVLLHAANTAPRTEREDVIVAKLVAYMNRESPYN